MEVDARIRKRMGELRSGELRVYFDILVELRPSS